MVRWLYTMTAAAALVGTGLVHGFWTNRWIEDRASSDAAARLAHVSPTLGEWESQDIQAKAAPGVVGSLQRSYTNRRLNVTVNIALVNGQPGPVATHTPEVCYGASGYLVGQREPFRLDEGGKPARFWTSDAVRKRATEETRLRLYWGWNGGQGWVASDDARSEFSRSTTPVLHKLYVIREIGAHETNARAKDEACVQLLHALLPELEKTLFSQGG